VTAPTIVFVLCFLTSCACGLLLARSFRRTRTRLLLWAALAFGFLALNNFILVLDAVVYPDIDLRGPRLFSALAAVSILLYGFIWETD
jgi:hypothetical protein